MLYYFFKYLESEFQFPGASLFNYLSFRSLISAIFSLFISLVWGKYIINYMNRKQIFENIRNLNLSNNDMGKKVPTMGGIIIILSTLIPVFLFCDLHNIYIIILIVTVIWMGLIGFADDYIKVFKKNKKGLKGIFKIVGQFILGVFVASTLYFHPDVVVKNNDNKEQVISKTEVLKIANNKGFEKSTKTTVPFLKNKELDYAFFVSFLGNNKYYVYIFFVIVVILIIMSVSNGANLTDGIDGLAVGISTIISIVIAIFTWVSGNIIFSKYLDIMYIPYSGEIVVFIACFIGALIGFLWYNTNPAQIYMGDTGSLTIGALIAVICIAIKKELLIPLLCGVFLIESLSVIIQVTYFKYTKFRFGSGRRVFMMSPIHHHYQKLGLSDSKIVVRFWIAGVLLAIMTVLILKVR